MKSRLILSILSSILLGAGFVVAADPAVDNTKAARLIVPKLVFREATVNECLAFLRVKSRELDPDKTGVVIILVASEKAKETTVDLDLLNVSLVDAVKYFSIAAGLEMTRDEEAIILKSK